MSKFIYKVKSAGGDLLEGEIEAADQVSASEVLRKENNFIISIKEINTSAGFGFSILNRISLRDKLIFVQQLAIMVKSGFPVVRALESISNQCQNPHLRDALKEVKKYVEEGQPLSAALMRQPNILPPMYIQIIASGEKSGKLEKLLLRIAKDLENTYKLISGIKSAMVYPIFVLFSMLGVVIIIMVTAIPQLKAIFEDAGIKLPFTTRVLLASSDIMIHWWWLILIILILLFFSYFYAARTPTGQLYIDRMKIRIPIFGLLQKKIYAARFVRMLNILTSSGLPILETFKTIKETIGNVIYATEIETARQRIENGLTISAALKENKIFPALIPELISVGEQSGNLEFVLANLTRFYENDVKYMTKNLSTLLEPLLMLILGVGVAFVVAAVIMPIYGLVNVIK